MSLTANEVYSRGFVRTASTGVLAVTRATAGTTVRDGFLRDADGRIVVKAS